MGGQCRYELKSRGRRPRKIAVERHARAVYRDRKVTESPPISIPRLSGATVVLPRNFWRGSSRGGLYTTFHLTPKPVEFKKGPRARRPSSFLPSSLPLFFFSKSVFPTPTYAEYPSASASREQRAAVATGLKPGAEGRVPPSVASGSTARDRTAPKRPIRLQINPTGWFRSPVTRDSGDVYGIRPTGLLSHGESSCRRRLRLFY